MPQRQRQRGPGAAPALPRARARASRISPSSRRRERRRRKRGGARPPRPSTREDPLARPPAPPDPAAPRAAPPRPPRRPCAPPPRPCRTIASESAPRSRDPRRARAHRAVRRRRREGPRRGQRPAGPPSASPPPRRASARRTPARSSAASPPSPAASSNSSRSPRLWVRRRRRARAAEPSGDGGPGRQGRRARGHSPASHGGGPARGFSGDDVARARTERRTRGPRRRTPLRERIASRGGVGGGDSAAADARAGVRHRRVLREHVRDGSRGDDDGRGFEPQRRAPRVLASVSRRVPGSRPRDRHRGTSKTLPTSRATRVSLLRRRWVLPRAGGDGARASVRRRAGRSRGGGARRSGRIRCSTPRQWTATLSKRPFAKETTTLDIVGFKAKAGPAAGAALEAAAARWSRGAGIGADGLGAPASRRGTRTPSRGPERGRADEGSNRRARRGLPH